MEQLGSNLMDFYEIWYQGIFRNYVANIQILLKSDKNKQYFTWRSIYSYIYFHLTLNSSSNEKFLDKSCRENKTFFYRAVLETMWKNTVEPDRPQMTIWRMRIAYWITKATNTHSQYVTLTFPLQQWLHERSSMLPYTFIFCLVILL